MSNASSAPSHATVLPNGWEMVIGLEVHVELDTKTKLFSASPNHFGDEPNTNIDPVTLGLPGALPGAHSMPVGVQILAPALGETTMFRVAAELERAS